MMNFTKLARPALLALAITAASGPALCQGDPDPYGRSPSPLEGSWEVVLKPKNCTTGVETPFQLPSYQTFNAGGTMLETTANPGFLPGQRTSGHGHWQRTDFNVHEAAFQAFILFDGDPNAVPPNTYKRGQMRIAQVIEFVDADHWQSDARTFFWDATGTLYRQGCANGVATRMP
jgi:hypothetical protein